MEIFKDIAGYEGLYQASNYGNIKSFYTNKIIIGSITKNGYYTISLVKGKNKISKSIHRIIAATFYGDSNLDVNHKDGNKLNNHIGNLEYVTKSQNIRHAMLNGLLVQNTKKIAEEKRKKVAKIDMLSNQIIEVYNSTHEASKLTKINRGNICSVCRGEKIHAGKYFWKYLI